MQTLNSLKFIYSKLVLLFSLLVIRVSERNFKSSRRSFLAPKILLCLEREIGCNQCTLFVLCRFFLQFIYLVFPLPVSFRQKSIFALIRPGLDKPQVPVARANTFLTMSHRVCVFSTWKLLRVKFLASRILKLL
jgi:hypothetical protein